MNKRDDDGSHDGRYVTHYGYDRWDNTAWELAPEFADRLGSQDQMLQNRTSFFS